MAAAPVPAAASVAALTVTSQAALAEEVSPAAALAAHGAAVSPAVPEAAASPVVLEAAALAAHAEAASPVVPGAAASPAVPEVAASEDADKKFIPSADGRGDVVLWHPKLDSNQRPSA